MQLNLLQNALREKELTLIQAGNNQYMKSTITNEITQLRSEILNVKTQLSQGAQMLPQQQLTFAQQQQQLIQPQLTPQQQQQLMLQQQQQQQAQVQFNQVQLTPQQQLMLQQQQQQAQFNQVQQQQQFNQVAQQASFGQNNNGFSNMANMTVSNAGTTTNLSDVSSRYGAKKKNKAPSLETEPIFTISEAEPFMGNVTSSADITVTTKEEVKTTQPVRITPLSGHEFKFLTAPGLTATKTITGDYYKYNLTGNQRKGNLSMTKIKDILNYNISEVKCKDSDLLTLLKVATAKTNKNVVYSTVRAHTSMLANQDTPVTFISDILGEMGDDVTNSILSFTKRLIAASNEAVDYESDTCGRLDTLLTEFSNHLIGDVASAGVTMESISDDMEVLLTDHITQLEDTEERENVLRNIGHWFKTLSIANNTEGIENYNELIKNTDFRNDDKIKIIPFIEMVSVVFVSDLTLTTKLKEIEDETLSVTSISYSTLYTMLNALEFNSKIYLHTYDDTYLITKNVYKNFYTVTRL